MWIHNYRPQRDNRSPRKDIFGKARPVDIGRTAVFCSMAILIITLTSACFLFNYHDYMFDISRDMPTVKIKAASSISEAPFCQFSKYEITVFYVWIALYDIDGPGDGTGPGYTKHTIINRPADEGIKIDLVNESLSDKAREDELWITNAAGNGVEAIFIAAGNTVTVRGYVYHQSQLYHSTSKGFVPGEGTPENIELSVSWGNDLVEVPGDPIDETLIGNATSTTLHIAPSGIVVGHDHVTLNDMETLRIIVPVDIGIITPGVGAGAQDWMAIDFGASTPYIEGSTIYEKYYLKRVGEPNYTDVLRFLFDRSGNLINGQCRSITLDYYANSVFSQFDFCHVSFEELSEAAYNQAFGINPDGTIYFDSRIETGSGEVYAPAFARGDHTGTIEVMGEQIAYQCIKVF